MTKLNNLYNIIAEDDSDDAQTIVESFNAHGAFIRVDVVANGKELLDSLVGAEIKPTLF